MKVWWSVNFIEDAEESLVAQPLKSSIDHSHKKENDMKKISGTMSITNHY